MFKQLLSLRSQQEAALLHCCAMVAEVSCWLSVNDTCTHCMKARAFRQGLDSRYKFVRNLLSVSKYKHKVKAYTIFITRKGRMW